MGCKASTLKQVRQNRAIPKGEESARSEQPLESQPFEKPKPVIFAIIRNGHEVVRGSLRDISSLLERGDLEVAVKEWEDLRKWWHMHLTLEIGKGTEDKRGGFLRVVDKHCQETASKQNFFQEYDALLEREEELNAAFETEDMFQIKATFFDFQDELLALLQREDELLMPCVDEMEERGLNLKRLMKNDVLGGIAQSFGFESFVRYAMKQLERHHGGMPRVRVYGFALYTVATRKEWDKWKIWIQATVSPSTYEELLEVIHQEKQ